MTNPTEQIAQLKASMEALEARRLGAATVCTHGEAIHAWMRLMMRPTLTQDRLG